MSLKGPAPPLRRSLLPGAAQLLGAGILKNAFKAALRAARMALVQERSVHRGYLFRRPMEVERFEALLATGGNRTVWITAG